MAGVPAIATVHGLSSALWYRVPDRLVAVSDAVKAHLVAQGLPGERITVVHNGIDLARYLPAPLDVARTAAGFDGAPRAGFFGRLSPEKGPDLAVQAWPAVRQAVAGARLLLVGDGKQRADLEKLVAELGLADAVDFAGYRADPRPLLAACDVIDPHPVYALRVISERDRRAIRISKLLFVKIAIRVT